MARLQGQFNFRPTIMPLPGEPTEEFNALMDSRIEAFDQGAAAEAQFNNTLSTFAVAPGYEGIRNELATTAEQRLSQLAEKYEGAYEDPRFQREALMAQRDLIRNPAFNTLAQNKVNYELYNQQRIENPDQYDFNTYEDHVAGDANTGQPSLFKPHRENKLDINAAADNAIEPFISYLETRPEYRTMTRKDAAGNVIGYSFVGREKVDFKISDAWDSSATAAQKKEALGMVELLREHSLDAFKRDDAGNQYMRKRQQIDGLADPAELDEEMMDILIDRFPGVKSFKEKGMGTISTVKSGSGTDKEEEVTKRIAINDPVEVKDVPEEMAFQALQLQAGFKDDEAGITQEQRQAALDQNFTVDGNGRIGYAGEGMVASPGAAAQAEQGLSDMVSAKNARNSIVGVTSSAARAAKINEEYWTDMADWDSLDQVALAKDWFGEDGFQTAKDQETQTPGFIDSVVDAGRTFWGSIADDDRGEARLEKAVETRTAQNLLESDPRWTGFIKDLNKRSLVALEQNSTSFPRLQFNPEGQDAKQRLALDADIQEVIAKNFDKFTIYNTTDYTQDDSDDILEKVADGTHGVKLISYLPAGARKEDNQGSIKGAVDPHQGEIEIAVVEKDKSGKLTGQEERVIVRGYNVDNNIIPLVATDKEEMADTQLRVSVANIIESGMIPAGEFYDLSPNEINLALNATADPDQPHRLTYSELFRNFYPDGLANLPTKEAGTVNGGTDYLNVSIKRERSPLGNDEYSLWRVSDGVRTRVDRLGEYDVFPVAEADAPNQLSAILSAYYNILVSNYDFNK